MKSKTALLNTGAVILLNGVQYGRKSIQNRNNDQARI